MEVLEAALASTRRDQCLNDIRTDIADSGEAEPDVGAARGEVHIGVVDIRWKHLDAHAPTFIEIDRGAILVITDAGEQGSHVLGRIVGLEVCGPIRHQAVAGCVRFIECVVRERDEDLPQPIDGILGVAIGAHTVAEWHELLLQDLLLLLSHCATEQVRFAKGVSSELLGNRHDLLLVDDQAVGIPQDRLQRLGEFGMDRHHGFTPVLAIGVVVVGIRTHRAGAVERQDRRDVLEVVRLHGTQERSHGTAIELEDAEGVAAGEELVGGAIFQMQGLQFDRRAAIRDDVGQAIVQNGEVPQPQEVHLEQAERLTSPHVELGDDGTVLLPAPYRDDIEQWLATQDDAGRMHARLTLQAFQALRSLDDLTRIGIGIEQGAELRCLLVSRIRAVEDPGEGDVLAHHRRRHRLRDLVTEGIGEAENARSILDRRLRLDGPEGDDLGDALLTVFLRRIADHVGATTFVEVDIDIGHRDTFGVQEAFEQQAVLHRVELGDTEGIGDHRARCGASPRADSDSVLLGITHEVGDHQEVRGEPHLTYDVDLVRRLGAHRIGHRPRIAVLQATFHFLDQPRFLGFTGRNREGRQEGCAFIEVHLTALRDEQCVVAGLGEFAPGVPHFLRRHDVEVTRVEAEALRIVHRGARTDAQQNIVRVSIVRMDVVGVIGRDKWEIQCLRDTQEIRAELPLDAQPMIHQFDEVVARTQDVTHVRRGTERPVVLTRLQPAVDFPARTPSRTDQP